MTRAPGSMQRRKARGVTKEKGEGERGETIEKR